MRLIPNGAWLVIISIPLQVPAQEDASGIWRTVLADGETITLDLAQVGTALEGSVEFENRRLERITEGTIEREPGTPSWRIHFVTPGLLNDQDVILIWEGEANARGQMTLQTTIQVFNGRKIELDTPRSYRRISRD